MSFISALRIANVASRTVLINSASKLKLKPSISTVIPANGLRITPALQRRIRGPETEAEKIDDVHHWKNERIVAVALLPIIPTAMLYPNIFTDNLLVSAMVLHTYWRLSGVAEDYIHGEVLPKIAQPVVKIMTILALGGLFYFNYNDMGFCEAVRTLYTRL